MSGTSLSTAIAKLNGSTNRHSAHTGGRDRGRAEVRVDAEVDDDAAHAGDAQRGGDREALEPQRRERVGAPTASAGGDRDASPTPPCVSAMRDRQHRQTATIARAPAVRQLARRDRQVRLVDAVDLDVGDLVDADDRDVDGERRDQRREQVAAAPRPVALGAAIAYRPGTLSAVPIDRVRAREAPQHARRRARRARRRLRPTAVATWRPPRRCAEPRAQRQRRSPTGTKAAPAASRRRSAPRSAARLDGRRRRSAARARSGEARRGLDAADRERVRRAAVAVPVGRELAARMSREAGAAGTTPVLVGAGEQHPRLGEPARDAVGRADRADHQRRRRPARSRGRPRRCRAAGPASTRSSRPRRSGRTRRRANGSASASPSTLRAVARAPAWRGRARAGAGSGRASSRARDRTRATIPSVVKPGPGAGVERLQLALVEPRRLQRLRRASRASRTAGSPSCRSRATGTGRTSTPPACAGSAACGHDTSRDRRDALTHLARPERDACARSTGATAARRAGRAVGRGGARPARPTRARSAGWCAGGSRGWTRA